MRSIQLHLELPKALSAEEEKRYIEHLPDLWAEKKLIEGNLRLALYISKQYDSYSADDLEDLFSIGAMALVIATRKFSTEKDCKFATYATHCIHNGIRMYLRYSKKFLKNISLESVISTDDKDNELCLIDMLPSPIKFTEISEKADTISRLLTTIINTYSRQEIIVFFYTLSGKNQSEIGKIVSISQSYISRMQKKIFDKNRNLLKNKLEYDNQTSIDYLGDEILLVTFKNDKKLYSFLRDNQAKYYCLIRAYKDRIKVVGFMQDIFFILAELSRLALI